MPFEWPKGSSFAICITFDLDAEEVWRVEGGWDAAARSQGSYGVRVGVPHIVELLDRRALPASFFVVGRVAEDHPEAVGQILEAGHEVASHGYTHRPPISLPRWARERELVRSREILEDLGAEVAGYRAPGWEMAPSDVALLRSLGFRYSSNFMDDLLPYVHPGTEIVELPVHWVLDDAPHFWFGPAEWSKKISEPTEIRRLWEEEIFGIADRGGLCVITLHPQIIARPGRMRMLDDLLRLIGSLSHAWVVRCDEVASYVRSRPDSM